MLEEKFNLNNLRGKVSNDKIGSGGWKSEKMINHYTKTKLKNRIYELLENFFGKMS
jgi:hypothetical protein